ncbi:hypothetical protein BDV97DRAFT_90931 [Delphinella strobiligena]|nr:hypothetical protein BDV97DRAFT_90931 [Delphinella strobiligena]
MPNPCRHQAFAPCKTPTEDDGRHPRCICESAWKWRRLVADEDQSDMQHTIPRDSRSGRRLRTHPRRATSCSQGNLSWSVKWCRMRRTATRPCLLNSALVLGAPSRVVMLRPSWVLFRRLQRCGWLRAMGVLAAEANGAGEWSAGLSVDEWVILSPPYH